MTTICSRFKLIDESFLKQKQACRKEVSELYTVIYIKQLAEKKNPDIFYKNKNSELFILLYCKLQGTVKNRLTSKSLITFYCRKITSFLSASVSHIVNVSLLFFSNKNRLDSKSHMSEAQIF
jgi:hypothetical protein